MIKIMLVDDEIIKSGLRNEENWESSESQKASALINPLSLDQPFGIQGNYS